MIHELLSVGSENARTGRELAEVLQCKPRMITKQIERERRNGHPICASSNGENAGYYLPAGTADLERYCRRLAGRTKEMAKTLRALSDILERNKKKELADAGTDHSLIGKGAPVSPDNLRG